MEDPTFDNRYEMESFGYPLDELHFQSFSAESYSSYPDLSPKRTHEFTGSAIENPDQTGALAGRPAKQLKTSSWNSCTTDHITSKAASSSSSQLISFENSNSPPATSQKFLTKTEAGCDGNLNFPTFISQSSFEMQNCSPKHGSAAPKRVGATTRTPLNAQDHVIAERKRREKLSQRFIALSAVVPGLKKVRTTIV
jgi:hypothetical protein